MRGKVTVMERGPEARKPAKLHPLGFTNGSIRLDYNLCKPCTESWNQISDLVTCAHEDIQLHFDVVLLEQDSFETSQLTATLLMFSFPFLGFIHPTHLYFLLPRVRRQANFA